MSTVTSIVKSTKQPRGGYVPLSSFERIPMKDVKVNADFNIAPNIVGTCVDYMTRFMIGNNPRAAFKISLLGARNAARMGVRDSYVHAEEAVESIVGLTPTSVIAACRLCNYDVYYRNPQAAQFVPATVATPDKITIDSIIQMVDSCVHFFNTTEPVMDYGFTFEPCGYDGNATDGDGDFMTKTTMWDMKVSKYNPNKDGILALLMYFMMSKQSCHAKFRDVWNIGIINPLLGAAWKLCVEDIPAPVLLTIERDVCGFKDLIFYTP